MILLLRQQTSRAHFMIFLQLVEVAAAVQGVCLQLSLSVNECTMLSMFFSSLNDTVLFLHCSISPSHSEMSFELYMKIYIPIVQTIDLFSV